MSSRSQLGHFGWNVVPFGLQGSSSLLMRVMNEALTVGLGPSPRGSGGEPAVRGGVSGPLGRCTLVYMDDCLVHSPTLAKHLLDVAEVLQIFRRRTLFARRSKCEFGRLGLGFLGHRLSAAGVSVDPRKGDADVVHGGAALHGPGQLLPPLRGGLCRDCCPRRSAARRHG
mmetsp:Transcript_56278/g.117623  ORF Transcript_56278/g.117623 Transcript_56278/m.117623 type:complete len:170 (-) Transcript_56278:690-1199(-)